MCGIGGMLGEPQAILSLNSLMDHRGPDGQGIFRDDNCGLAHTRLAIVDIVGSPQPIYGPGKVAVVNGEIYNHLSLKSSMYQYTTNGDSEVVLSLHRAKEMRQTMPSGYLSWMACLPLHCGQKVNLSWQGMLWESNH